MLNRENGKKNAVIKVVGVGGGGGNAVNSMIDAGVFGVDFIVANTDLQALEASKAPIKIQLGRELTKGLGAGANPDVGRDSAIEDKSLIQEQLIGADMVFVTAGMGGGTGTGAAPIIAQVARELGALTVAVVTKPFAFEKKRRHMQADQGISSLRQNVDTIITIPNQRLISIAPPEMTVIDGFKMADQVLVNAVKGISDIINVPGTVNVDFADIKTTMQEKGMALMGIGSASGENRARDAALSAINSPLLEDMDIKGATGILINITAGPSFTLNELSQATGVINEAASEDVNTIFGLVTDPGMGDSIRITVIATGFNSSQEESLTSALRNQATALPYNSAASQASLPTNTAGHPGWPQAVAPSAPWTGPLTNPPQGPSHALRSVPNAVNAPSQGLPPNPYGSSGNGVVRQDPPPSAAGQSPIKVNPDLNATIRQNVQSLQQNHVGSRPADVPPGQPTFARITPVIHPPAANPTLGGAFAGNEPTWVNHTGSDTAGAPVRPVSGASAAPSEAVYGSAPSAVPHLHPQDPAQKMAEEIGMDVPISESDLDVPAFLRKPHEGQKSQGG